MDQGGIFLRCGDRIKDPGQRFIVNFYQGAGCGGDLGVGGRNRRDFIPELSDFIMFDRRIILNKADPKIRGRIGLPGQNCFNSGKFTGLADINILNNRVGVFTAFDLAVEHVWHGDVVNIGGLAVDLFGRVHFCQAFADEVVFPHSSRLAPSLRP